MQAWCGRRLSERSGGDRAGQRAGACSEGGGCAVWPAGAPVLLHGRPWPWRALRGQAAVRGAPAEPRHKREHPQRCWRASTRSSWASCCSRTLKDACGTLQPPLLVPGAADCRLGGGGVGGAGWPGWGGGPAAAGGVGQPRSLPVARHAKRGLILVKPTLNSFQGLFWLGWPQT
jgi:hypothetical protein